MAILGYNSKGSTSAGLTTGAWGASKFTLASPATLTELHGWFGGSATNIILFIYSDVAGTPTNRLAYTSPIALTGGDAERSQTGFSVALTAGDYWIGFTSQGAGTGGVYWRDATGGTHYAVTSGATFNPPSNPFAGGGSGGTRKYSMWAVVGAAAGPAFVPQIVIT
jgi:hypothetical protein